MYELGPALERRVGELDAVRSLRTVTRIVTLIVFSGGNELDSPDGPVRRLTESGPSRWVGPKLKGPGAGSLGRRGASRGKGGESEEGGSCIGLALGRPHIMSARRRPAAGPAWAAASLA